MRKLLILACLVASPAFGADCFISEYRGVVDHRTPVAKEPAIAVQQVTYTTASVQSAAFNEDTKFIRIICNAAAHFEVGANPTADASDPYLAQDTAEYFGVTPGDLIAVDDG